MVALALYLILRFAWPDSGLEAFVAFVTYVLGAWISLRLLRIGLRKLTWRLRNRLMVAYLFIAVLPILLVLTLVGLGAYMLAGQVAVYLVRSELDRRLIALRSVADDLNASPAAIQRVDEAQQRQFPGLILWTARNDAIEEWPADADVSWPAGLPVNAEWIRIAPGTLLRLGGYRRRQSADSGVDAAHPPFSERAGAGVGRLLLSCSANTVTSGSVRASRKPRCAGAPPRLARESKRSFG